MSYSIKIVFIALLLVCCKQKEVPGEISQSQAGNSVNTDDCDNPDADITCCFANIPSKLTSTMVIADDDKNSEKLTVSGTIYRKDGKTPYPDVILYAYHTDAKGEYSKNGNEKGVQKWHGYHHGWCKTDQNGNYQIHTIRPASYPNSTAPAHIHAAVKLPNDPKPFYINDFLFKDDPYLPKKEQNRFSYQGGSGIMDVKKINNIWVGKRDMSLQ
ncbi:dioxygenase family protein [Flavobacterium pedocola]